MRYVLLPLGLVRKVHVSSMSFDYMLLSSFSLSLDGLNTYQELAWLDFLSLLQMRGTRTSQVGIALLASSAEHNDILMKLMAPTLSTIAHRRRLALHQTL